MRHGKGLRRKKALAARTQLQQLRRTGLAPGKGLAPGGGPKRARPPVDAAATLLDQEASGAWHHYVLLRARGRCECGCRRNPGATNQLQAHHVLAQQHIKAYVRGLQLPAAEARVRLRGLLWDRRNGMALLEECHRRHTLQHRPVRQAALRPEHWQYARELGLVRLLERQYTA